MAQVTLRVSLAEPGRSRARSRAEESDIHGVGSLRKHHPRLSTLSCGAPTRRMCHTRSLGNIATKVRFEPLSPDAALRSNWRNARKADMAAQANGPDLPFDRTYCAALQHSKNRHWCSAQHFEGGNDRRVGRSRPCRDCVQKRPSIKHSMNANRP